MITLYFVGLLNNAAMTAGFGLAAAYVVIIGTSVLTGMNSAQETLTSQASGAQELRRCGHLHNRGRVILLLLCVPMIVLLASSERIFLFVGQNGEVAKYASQYCKISIIGILFYGQFDLTKRFLIQLQVSWVPMIAQFICIALHPLFCWLFVIKLGYGVWGAGVAMASTNILEFTSVTVIAYAVPRISDAMFLSGREAFEEWGEYMGVSVPATIILCAERWSFEVTALITGYLGVAMQAAYVISSTVLVLMSQPVLGF
jgi:multidrug resistance protein, MATE family